MTFSDQHRIAAALMLDELQRHHPHTIKIPSSIEGYIRVPIETNCQWYRSFCSEHEKPRRRYPKPRTLIRRVDTIRNLRNIIEGRANGQLYVERLQPHVDRYADQHAGLIAEIMKAEHSSPQRTNGSDGFYW